MKARGSDCQQPQPQQTFNEKENQLFPLQGEEALPYRGASVNKASFDLVPAARRWHGDERLFGVRHCARHSDRRL